MAERLVQRGGLIIAEIIGREQLLELTKILQKYHAGKANLERRVIEAEQWWKLRNLAQIQAKGIKQPGQIESASGWLHNVIVSKHADAIDAYPEPNILPREEGDKGEARMLSSIVPCILEQNRFEDVYSANTWQKLKTGTAVYKVIWDQSKLNGLGDISITRRDLLNIFWEPGITDIQDSRYVFDTALVDKDLLAQTYPQYAEKMSDSSFVAAKFLYDDNVPTDGKVTVIEVYYHKQTGNRKTLHYIKYVNDVLLYASENDDEVPTALQPMQTGVTEDGQPIIEPVEVPTGEPISVKGWYDHGFYPFVMDALFPVEGSPCGYGFVDLCRSTQEQIDIMGKAITDNSVWSATPRYFSRNDGNVNEVEFTDTSKPIVHVAGNLDDITLRQITVSPLSSIYATVLNNKIQELREVSGNTESATGSTPSGVTAASAIAALQEASGKGSKASTLSAYRAFTRIVEMCIELIRQFYDMPRKFRIVGQYGMEQYVTYSNQGLQPQAQGVDFGMDMGYRLPVFDVKVSAQKKSVYTRVSQNELALQFFQLGFFNPQMTDQALMALDMMDFDGKDGVVQKVSQNGTMYQQLILYQQLALTLAAKYEPGMVQGLSNNILSGMGMPAVDPNANISQVSADEISGLPQPERANVRDARASAQEASRPDGGQVIKERGGDD